MVQFYFHSVTYDDPNAENKIKFNLKIKVDPISEFSNYSNKTKIACIKYSKDLKWRDEVNVNESSFDNTNGTFIIEKCSNHFISYLYENYLKEKDVQFRYNKNDMELQIVVSILKMLRTITFS